MSPLSGEKVLVTGATGFLGRHVVTRLLSADARVFPVSRALGYDLTWPSEAYRAFLESRASIAIHLAARVGGIGANRDHPDRFFTDNLRMGMNVVEAAASARARLVTVGTICSFPKLCPVPFQEKDLWNGFPEETNAPYGIAKRSLLVMLAAYRAKRDLLYAYLMPTNLYGPGDNFDPGSSHVIPALLRKFSEAARNGDRRVVVWGTGKPTRSFLYVEDAAEALVAAAEGLDYDGPVNLGGGPEIAIEDLVSLVAQVTGYEGDIFWDSTKPDGQPRRAVDGTLAKKLLGWEPKTPFEQGLQATYEWWQKENEPNTVPEAATSDHV